MRFRIPPARSGPNVPGLRAGALLLAVLAGCAPAPEFIRDVAELAQDAAAYVDPASADSLLVPMEVQNALDARFDSLTFSVWRGRPRAGRESAAWGFGQYAGRAVYGENKRRIPAAWFEALERNADLGSFPNRSGRAVATANTDLRVLPSARPVFLDFSLPGEGFPFDQLQQSRLAPGTPLFVLHESRDGDWLYAVSPAASGWVAAEHAAWADWAFIWQWSSGRFAAVVEDETPVRAADGRFLYKAPFGSLFPFLGKDDAGLRVLAPVPDSDRRALAVEARLAPDAAAVKPVPLTALHLARAVNALLGEPYGWGGMYGDRDCSSAMKDLFAPFGLFLPRNSAAQARAGAGFLDLGGLSDAEKEKAVCLRGKPFLTLLHLKGHVMLYLGCRNGHPVVFHNLWGIRTKNFWGKEGRHIIGQAVITSLSPGRELRNADRGRGLLRRVERMTFYVPASEEGSDGTAGPGGLP